jgi:hypothetical protein
MLNNTQFYKDYKSFHLSTFEVMGYEILSLNIYNTERRYI